MTLSRWVKAPTVREALPISMRPNMLMCFPTARLRGRGRGTPVDDTQPPRCCPNQESELAWLQASL